MDNYYFYPDLPSGAAFYLSLIEKWQEFFSPSPEVLILIWGRIIKCRGKI
jgi:hypothetical protein